MSIHVALNHVTHYRYDRPIHLGPQIVRLRPAPHSRTRILSYSMRVEPATHFINWQQDPQANYLARLVFPDKTTTFRIEIDLVAEMATLNPFDFFLEPSAEHYPFAYEPEVAAELEPYLAKAPAAPAFAAYLAEVPREKTPTNNWLVALNQKLQRDIGYVVRLEPGVQTPEETLQKASGSCRDTGWLLVQLLRHLGLAARFVSGYLIQLKSDVKSLDGPSGTEVDFTDLHAWCEVFLPGAGWIGLDPTSGLLAGEGHIPLACSPDPGSAAPVSGALEECVTTFEHTMSVRRVWEAPRVTLPYTDEQWSAIDALGHQVDRDLRRNDVRLTQGGEPTFVSVDDREGAEWNTEAMGPTKRLLSAELMDKLRAKYGQGGLLHYGQGKWYPGEQLPRWSLNLFWRKDKEPIWSHPELVADEHRDYGATEAHAHRLLAGVAKRLGLDPQYVFPAYEDTWYYLWRERKLPSNVDPFDARLADPLERDRIRKVFTQGLDKVVGHAFPVARNPGAGARWQTGPWFLRAERCYLIPGDSALGYRLPLDSQPWARDTDLPWIHPVDQTQPFPPLPPYRRLRHAVGPHEAGGPGSAASSGADSGSFSDRSRAAFSAARSATGSAAPGVPARA
ncbi:MAG: transglutaminase family protein, partial [Pseudomonadota bacterium]|nr:transglutaminase family protein [Pseudomonadota bacterium]